MALLQVESTARSWRAAGLLLMRQTVDQENRQAIVRGTICLIYLVRMEAWPLELCCRALSRLSLPPST